MIFLPISINITDKQILVVGGGKVAAHKTELLLPFTKNITVIAPEICEKLLSFNLTYRFKSFEESDLDGHFIVYSCTNISEVNKQVKNLGNARNMLVSVVDNPPECDFVSPAIFKQNNMTVAVGSNAQDVKNSILWRNKIKRFFEDGTATNY